MDIYQWADVDTILCSFGKNQRTEIFRPGPWTPLVSECDGYLFTDYRVGYHRTVDVYRDWWVGPKMVGVRGDKGQVAQLLRAPGYALRR